MVARDGILKDNPDILKARNPYISPPRAGVTSDQILT